MSCMGKLCRMDCHAVVPGAYDAGTVEKRNTIAITKKELFICYVYNVQKKWEMKMKMKIAALIDEPGTIGRWDQRSGISVYKKIKEQIRADELIVVTSGSFGQDGSIMEIDKYQMADQIRSQGAELVLELPVYCTLTTFDTFAFGAVSMLEKLNCVDELVVFTENTDEKILTEIVQFLFIESGEYQKELKKCRAGGMGFVQAQAAVTGRYIPGAEEVLLCETNRKAAEYMKAIKRMYSTMKVRLYDIGGQKQQESNKNEVGVQLKDRNDRRLAEAFSKMLEKIPEGEKEKYLDEISGGYEPKTKQLLCTYREKGIKDFSQFAGLLSTEERTVSDVKRYLLRAMLGIRQVDISICGLYSYAIYARALGTYDNCPFYEEVKKKAWIPLFSENAIEESPTDVLDESGRILTEIDLRAGHLHRQICGQAENSGSRI